MLVIELSLDPKSGQSDMVELGDISILLSELMILSKL